MASSSSKELQHYLEFLGYENTRDIPYKEIAKKYGVHQNAIIAKVRTAKHFPTIYRSLQETYGLQDHEIPSWFSRPRGKPRREKRSQSKSTAPVQVDQRPSRTPPSVSPSESPSHSLSDLDENASGGTLYQGEDVGTVRSATLSDAQRSSVIWWDDDQTPWYVREMNNVSRQNWEYVEEGMREIRSQQQREMQRLMDDMENRIRETHNRVRSRYRRRQ